MRLCINGWIMTAAAFLRDNRKPTETQIKDDRVKAALS
jgi:nicotinate dehydrogenase subunit A